MTLYRRYLTALALAVGLTASVATTACGTPSATTPAPIQNSPQSTVALTVKTVADADLAGVKTIIALRDAGKLSQANTTTIENWLGFVANADKSIGLILAKGEPWAQQKMQILTLLATVTAPNLATTIDPGAQAVVAQIMTLINQIRVQAFIAALGQAAVDTDDATLALIAADQAAHPPAPPTP